jgi:hypothetical protein
MSSEDLSLSRGVRFLRTLRTVPPFPKGDKKAKAGFPIQT